MVQPATPRTILVVDVERFSDYRRTDSQRVAVHHGLYDLLQEALRDVGIEWDDCHHEDRGDGALILAPAQIPKVLFSDYLPDRLADGLRLHNQVHPPEERMRLRMALHAGEVFFNEHGVVASSVNMAFRLLDAAPLKEALRHSSGVLTMIASSWFYHEVIRNSQEFRPEAYFPVLVDVKETNTTGWITMPGYQGAQRESWRIHLRDSGGGIHGPGILLCGRYAITSAHVAAGALRLRARDIASQPSGQVFFDVPAKPGLGVQRAEIIWWRPALPRGGEPEGLDIAGLSVSGPAIRGIDEPAFLLDLGPGSRIVRLRACSAASDGQDAPPTWARLPEHGVNGQERVLLSPVTEYSPAITSECRGSEVIDEQTGEILGVATTADSGSSRDHVWMNPIGKIATEWPLLRRIIQEGKRDVLNEMPSCALGRADILPLAAICLQIPALADAQSRHQIVTELPLDVMLTTPRSSVDRADIIALLWSCARVPGALIELAKKIRESSRGGRIAVDLANDLERFHARLLPKSLPYVIMPVAGGEVGSSR